MRNMDFIVSVDEKSQFELNALLMLKKINTMAEQPINQKMEYVKDSDLSDDYVEGSQGAVKSILSTYQNGEHETTIMLYQDTEYPQKTTEVRTE